MDAIRVLASAAALAVSVGPHVQQDVPPASGAGRSTFRAGVELVALRVTVTDLQRRPVLGLTRDDFLVLEDGEPQELSVFAAGDVPIDLALLIDTSSSMTSKLPLVQQAAIEFARALRPADRASVLSVNTRTEVLQSMTADRALVEQAIRRTAAGGQTALYAALYVALKDLGRTADSHVDGRRPAVVVLTDGDDTASPVSLDDVLELVRRSGVPIYTISIASATATRAIEDSGRPPFRTQSDYALNLLARESGGEAYFPLRLADLNQTYGAVARELGAQYSLAYVPQRRAPGGKFHSLLVRIVSRADVLPRTRLGYLSSR